MVNLGKRMRRLKPLLNVRSGQGAAILPTPSASSTQPRLTRVFLRYPVGAFKLDSAANARLFRHNHLRRLKYHNPALPISVEHERVPHQLSKSLTLTFEGTDPDALRALCKIKKPKDRIREKTRQKRLADKMELAKNGRMAEEEKEKLVRMQSPNFRNAPREGMKSELVDDLHNMNEVGGEVDTLEREAKGGDMEAMPDLWGGQTADNDDVVVNDQVTLNDEVALDDEATLDNKLTLDDEMLLDDESHLVVEHSEVELKVSQPEATTTEAGKPPALVYYTTLTLGLRGRSVKEIWSWFEKTTNCIHLRPSIEDRKERQELEAMLVHSEEDRERVKRGVDERKANDAMLKRARGEVEKLRAEA